MQVSDMPKPFRQLRPSGRREVFQPDRYGYGERMRRQQRALDGPSGFDLVVRVWWWMACGVGGAGIGIIAICAAAAVVCAVTGG